MFTGLITTTARAVSIDELQHGAKLRIAVQLDPQARGLGASICVDGVCLTVTHSDDEAVSFDIGFETLRKTTLGALQTGQVLNIEPAMRLGDAVGGHFVTGHVDCTAVCRSVAVRGECRELWFDVPGEQRAMIAEKGSVCVAGASLTVNDCDDAGFSVGLVPHTLQHTNLASVMASSLVNLEVDLLSRYVARALRAAGVTR